MGSQRPPLAALHLLGLLGEYPFWAVRQGTWARGARGVKPVLPSVSSGPTCCPSGVSRRVGLSRIPVLSPSSSSPPCWSHPQGPASALVLHRQGNLLTIQAESMPRSDSQPRNQAVQSLFKASFPLPLTPPHPAAPAATLTP